MNKQQLKENYPDFMVMVNPETAGGHTFIKTSYPTAIVHTYSLTCFQVPKKYIFKTENVRINKNLSEEDREFVIKRCWDFICLYDILNSGVLKYT